MLQQCLSCGLPYPPKRGVCRCPRCQKQYERERERPLQSPAWKSIRQVVLARSHGVCEEPGCTGQAIDVHHMFERADGNPLLASLMDLRALCKSHHSKHTAQGVGRW